MEGVLPAFLADRRNKGLATFLRQESSDFIQPTTSLRSTQKRKNEPFVENIHLDDNMKKQLLALMLLFQSVGLVWAETVQKLVISKNDGTEVSFLLGEDAPNVEFIDFDYTRRMRLRVFDSQLSTYIDYYLYIEDLDKMTIVDEDATQVENIMNEKDAKCQWKGNALLVEVFSDKSTVIVYDTEGKVFLSRKLAPGKYALSLSDIPNGTFLVKVNETTFKMVK
jgi:hypothetical protein